MLWVMPPPREIPIGLRLARAAKVAGRAFDDALVEAGGSQSTWLVLVSLTSRQAGTQRDLAAALGLREPTVTHHLSAMEEAGLVSRRRDPENRRSQQVELMAEGMAMFERLRVVAAAFDHRLRTGISAD